MCLYSGFRNSLDVRDALLNSIGTYLHFLGTFHTCFPTDLIFQKFVLSLLKLVIYIATREVIYLPFGFVIVC